MSSELQPIQRPQTSNASLADRIKAHRQTTGTFLLLDCSWSMCVPIDRERRAIDKLRMIARQLRCDAPTLRQVAFPAPGKDDDAGEILSDIPEPHGMTPLAEAITYAAHLGALHLIIVSDGFPNDSEKAKRAAHNARCRIDVFYVGEAGGPGEQFLRELASLHGGACDTVSLKTAQLETKIRGLLSA